MLDKLKVYLRIDGTDEDTFLSSLIYAAEQYIENGTGVTVDRNNDLHVLAVNILASHWYENREAIGNADHLKFSLQSIFTQIQYC